MSNYVTQYTRTICIEYTRTICIEFIDELLAKDGAGELDLEHSCEATIERIPTRARELFSECVSLVCAAMRSDSEVERRRADAAFMLLPRLLLTPGGGSDWWSSRTLRVVRYRCNRFLAFEWEELYLNSRTHAVDRPGEDGAAAAKQQHRVQQLAVRPP